MAVITPQSFVCTVDLKCGAGVMIEVPNLPISRIVTVFAPLPQFPAMDIVAFVAGKAVNGSFIFIQGSLVATVAHHHSVFAE